ncbi:phage repressor protein/antirepressor Ant [Salmonella enterica subsp. enterica]|nr:phage repressor protein/antirepressor Ant [Salmonella enterica subsp. enterica]MIY22284.1 phage repressor protein/antirepressor Ant [Salmonella enterica subsp. enterica]
MKSIAKAQNDFTIFKFGDSEIRVINKCGEPWFVAKDVCDALALTNSRKALTALDDDEKGVTLSYTLGGEQNLSIVSESGMYTLVLRCRDAVNKGSVPHKFRKWVTAEVLPSIRKHGEYVKGKKTTVEERTPLRDAVNMLVGKKGLRYDDAYNMVHQRFGIDSIDELSIEQIPLAVEYIHRVVLEGEFIGKQEELPSKKLNIPDITMEWWYSNNFPMRVGNLERYPGHKVWHDLTLTQPMMYGEDTKSPALFLIEILERMGFDMVAPRIEVETMRIMLGKGKRQIRVVGDGRVKYLLSL